MFVITASQRAGTTPLGQALSTSARLAYFGEVFHTSPNSAHSFMNWAIAQSLPFAGMMQRPFAVRALNDYFDQLPSGTAATLIDVKLNSWSAVSDAWRYPTEIPLAFDVITKRGAAFLFVRRQDLTGQVLSEVIARQIGKWHEQSLADTNSLQITVDLKLLRRHAQLIVDAERIMSAHLASRSVPHLSLWYEDLFTGDIVAPSIVNFMKQHLGGDFPSQLKVPIRKNAGDKTKIVTNYQQADEVVRAIERT